MYYWYDASVITDCASAAVEDVSDVGVVDDYDGGNEQELCADRNLLFVIYDNTELGYATFFAVKKGNNRAIDVHACEIREPKAKKH